MNQAGPDERLPVIISPEISKSRPELGVAPNRDAIEARVKGIAAEGNYDSQVSQTDFYVIASLRAADIQRIVSKNDLYDAIEMVWLDETCRAHLRTSVETIKAAACWRMFEARGNGIVWAVLDTGINAAHPHFETNSNVVKELSKSFIASEPDIDDQNGHGTHVAGIIAGISPPDKQFKLAHYEDDPDVPIIESIPGCISGIAPLTNIVVIKVLDRTGTGSASSIIRGLQYIRQLNQNSPDIRIHGANLSLGYPLEPESYGCGHSPICEEVNRAVDAGINVVVSCGNDGYGVTQVEEAGATRRVRMAIGMSISDPANAQGCIAVGSVHKGSPHKYGVSYFSSKGPTADGRKKPDLVAPGEKIVSCSADISKYQYIEQSGTSMAAPHVSGAIAAFLSVHREYVGDPRKVKKIFTTNAMDLGRNVSFQGHGMIDLLRAISAV
jgi:subtilisin family serine protease